MEALEDSGFSVMMLLLEDMIGVLAIGSMRRAKGGEILTFYTMSEQSEINHAQVEKQMFDTTAERK